MRLSRHLSGLLFFVLMTAPVPVRAGVPTPAELLGMIGDNPQLAMANASTDIATANLEKAMSALRPRAEINLDTKRFQSMRAVESRNSDVYGRLEIVQPLYDFGRSSGAIDAARSDTDARRSKALTVRNTLMLEGLAQYYALHASDLDVQALQEDNTIAFFRASRLQDKVAVGTANPIDVIDLRAKAEKAQYSYYGARSHNQEIRLRLQELTGVAFVETTFTPSPPDDGPFEVDVDKILERAESALPELVGLRRHKQAFVARRDAVGLRPRVEAYGRLGESTRNLRGREDWAVGARFVLPLYAGGEPGAERARFAAEIRRIDGAIEARRRALRREVHVAVLARNDNWVRIRAARTAYKATRQRLVLEQLQRTQDRQATIGGMSARLTHIEADLVRAIGAYHMAGARLSTLLGMHPGESFKANFLEDVKVAAE
jgi:adhesin transport system outer membrane protein